MKRTLLVLLVAAALLPAGARELDFALILDEPPVAAKTSSRSTARAAAVAGGLARIQASQRSLAAELARRKYRVTGSVQWLLNAVFVRATREQAAELFGLPGVSRVVHLPPIHMNMSTAADVVNAPAAWNAAGGVENAGAGVKIAIIDSGVDHTHPAFQDAALQPPAGYPKGEAAFTNGKIIVARSWVDELPWAEVRASDSRPDDITPRDRQGHGTAVAAIAAGVRHASPIGTISGIAPKAWLGNYKIFGSPGINDITRAPVVVQALEAAFTDGMDIATLAIGDPAVYGPLDRDPACGDTGSPADCDVRAQAVENAVRNGMTVVVSAGNDGNDGLRFPTLSTINTPGTAPSAITVGASTNAHRFFSRVRAGGQEFDALFGQGVLPPARVTAPVRDVGGQACGALASGSLTGTFAIIDRGGCTFLEKVLHAQDAGAAGVILVNAGSDVPIQPELLSAASIPTVMVGAAAGSALRGLAQSGAEATLDPALFAVPDTPDVVANFSSRGPTIGDANIKPELVAPGTGIYTATQNIDPNSELYNPSRYTSVSSASFAVPMAAGAAALVRQRYPGFNPAQVKSAVVNTAAAAADEGGQARIVSAGAGRLDVAAARSANITAVPSTLGFGVIGSATLPIGRTLRVSNHGASAATIAVAVAPRDQDTRARVTVSPASLTLDPGQSRDVTVTLGGERPAAGSYEGFVTLQGAGTTLRVPYLYAVGDNVAADIFPVVNGAFTGVPNDQDWLIAFRLVDRNGIAVANAPVQFRAVVGGGRIVEGDPTTDRLGIAAAVVDLGPDAGEQIFSATARGLTVEFFADARPLPTIAAGGVINAASGTVGRGLAPGSYASIFGGGMAPAAKGLSTNFLPLALGVTSVSFDAPGLSVPGRLSFTSPGQVNVQIPWELRNQPEAAVKITVDGISSAVYTLALHPYSPALFEYPEGGRQYGAVLDQRFALVSPANPARRGDVIQIYANGLGPVDPQPASGDPAPGAEPLARTLQAPTVTIGGRPAAVSFSGLAPNFVGLYQVNATVPQDVPGGNQPVVISIGGVDSKPVDIPVQP